jgi:hypothetical protein
MFNMLPNNLLQAKYALSQEITPKGGFVQSYPKGTAGTELQSMRTILNTAMAKQK